MAETEPGVTAWKEQTSAFDRVRSVAGTLSEPRSAGDIAAEAHVSENTARAHLERLVDMNVLLERERDGTAVYEPDPLHTRMQTLRELLDEHGHEELLAVKADLQEQIKDWRTEYDANSPAELRERAAETDTADETREIQATANEWDLLAYRLGIVEDAIENYSTYTRDSQASA